jgi:hypothetical protein
MYYQSVIPNEILSKKFVFKIRYISNLHSGSNFDKLVEMFKKYYRESLKYNGGVTTNNMKPYESLQDFEIEKPSVYYLDYKKRNANLFFENAEIIKVTSYKDNNNKKLVDFYNGNPTIKNMVVSILEPSNFPPQNDEYTFQLVWTPARYIGNIGKKGGKKSRRKRVGRKRRSRTKRFRVTR